VIGLGIVFVANGIMVSKALEHPSAPAAKDHYVEAEHYDEVLAEREAAAALGWTVDVQACPRGVDSGCALTITVADRDGAPVPGLSGSVAASRADTTALDRTGTLEAAAPGRYRTVLDLAEGGAYRFELRLTGGDAPWVGSRDVIVEEGQSSS
jgi:nitrogen fixation protein FixH